MKSCNTSPQPQILHVHTMRLDAASEAETDRRTFPLHVNTFVSSKMTSIHTVNGATYDQPLLNVRSLSDSNIPGNGDFGSDANPFTKPSDPPSLEPITPCVSNNELSSDILLSPQWSSAVGRATTGKSGRVIERLMAENDRLRRDLKLETLRREEEQKRGEMARGKMESLQSINDNLVHQANVDKASLARRERKIEELKADCESERTRRIEAEAGLKQVQRESDATIQDLKSKLNSESEKARRNSSQYNVLASSWKQLDDGYRRKTAAFREQLRQLNEEKDEDRAKLARLEIIVEQQRQEVDKMRFTKERIEKQYQEYIDEAQSSTREMREKAEWNEKENDRALEATRVVLGEMKHLINVKKFVREAD